MNRKRSTTISKDMSLVLRHAPQEIGIELDSSGWIDISELVSAFQNGGFDVSEEEIRDVVATSYKQRFALSKDGFRIRANQGHSLKVALGHPESQPPAVLFHGTPAQFLDAIKKEGLHKMKRHDVHLHESPKFATGVGRRRGRPVVLRVQAKQMHEDGFIFHVTPNHVWLTEHVPPKYLMIEETCEAPQGSRVDQHAASPTHYA